MSEMFEDRKIEAAVAATDRAGELARDAADCLEAFGAGLLNGFGLYADPSSQRAYLAKAVRTATEVLAAVDAIRCPTPEELRKAAEDGEAIAAL